MPISSRARGSWPDETGARLYLSGLGGDDWSYGYGAEVGATLLHDGSRIRVGRVELSVIPTPGHTPEHLAYLVTDTVAAREPMGAFTGDFLFVGDVGRPDLLERAANQKGTMEASARRLFSSLQRFRVTAGFSPDLARTRRGLLVREIARCGTPVDTGVRETAPTGPSSSMTRTSSSARYSRASPTRPATSR